MVVKFMEEVRSLNEFPIVRFLNLVREVFRSYPVFVDWNTLSFELDARENSVSFSNSFVFLKNGEPVGFVVTCIRRNRGRIDAMGVVESEKGSGLAQRILAHTLEVLRWQKVQKVILEVLETEKRAVRFYIKNGFKAVRRLDTFIKECPPVSSRHNFVKADYRWIHRSSLEASINLKRRLNWQREPVTLLLSDGRYKMARTHIGRDQGYLVWGSTKDSAYIVDCAPVTDAEVYDQMLNISAEYICMSENRASCTIAGVPENDPLHTSAERNGFRKVLTQLEMELHLY